MAAVAEAALGTSIWTTARAWPWGTRWERSAASGWIGCTAQGEVGDVDAVLAEDGADAADDAGDVVVADGDEGAVEGGLDVDAVVAEEAGRVAVEDGGGGAGVAVGGVEDELEDGADAAGGELLLVFLDADAALGCDGGGVDAVGGRGAAFAVGAVEDAGDGGVADEVGFAGGDAAGVGDLDVFEVAGGGVGEEVAEALGHLDVGGDLDVLLVRERGEVDGVLDDAELEVVADLHGELDADGLLGFVGGAGDVRGEDDVVEVEEGGVFEGLLVEDVEGGAGDVAGLDGVGEGLLDDELAAGAVDDADALLHDADGGLVDEAFGLGGEADVEGEVVGGLEDLVDGDEGDVVLAGDDGGDEGVVADEVHAEAGGAAGDLEADAAEADDAEGFAAELGALEGFFLPFAGVHGGVGAGDGAGERDHEAEGEFGYGYGVGAGGVHDDDAAMGGGVGVDVVYAYAGAADDAEFGGGLEEFGVGLDGGADDEGVGVGEFGGEAVFNLVGRDDLPAGLLLEDGESGGRDFFGENDLQG